MTTLHFAAEAWPVRARFTLHREPLKPDFLVAVKPALLLAVKPAFLLGAQSTFLLVPLVAEPTFILVVAREALGAIVSALGRLWHGAAHIALEFPPQAPSSIGRDRSLPSLDII